MRNPLDQIESRLRTWIESTLAVFSTGSPFTPLAHQLVLALQENMSEDESGRLTAPNRYRIFMRPDTLDTFLATPGQLDNLAFVLHESAQNAGIHFSAPLSLSALPSSALAPDEFDIQVDLDETVIGETAAVTLRPASQPRPTQDNLPNGAYLVLNGDQIFPLRSAVINIGRRSDNQIVLDDPRVSRSHAQLRAVRKQYILFDLNSTGGTYVNGRRIVQETLNPGDVISLAGVPLIYGEETNELPSQFGDTSALTPKPEDNE